VKRNLKVLSEVSKVGHKKKSRLPGSHWGATRKMGDQKKPKVEMPAKDEKTKGLEDESSRQKKKWRNNSSRTTMRRMMMGTSMTYQDNEFTRGTDKTQKKNRWARGGQTVKKRKNARPQKGKGTKENIGIVGERRKGPPAKYFCDDWRGTIKN